jgi:TPR repeat protein
MERVSRTATNKRIKHSAQFNLGKVYFQGFGTKQSDKETEKWWLLAADDGNPNACVTAMTMLAFFYSRKTETEYFDLNKAYFWHNEACGNGSLESQGELADCFDGGFTCTTVAVL